MRRVPTVSTMSKPNAYAAIIEEIFVSKFERGLTRVDFERPDIAAAAQRRGVPAPSNVGDTLNIVQIEQDMALLRVALSGTGLSPGGRAVHTRRRDCALRLREGRGRGEGHHGKALQAGGPKRPHRRRSGCLSAAHMTRTRRWSPALASASADSSAISMRNAGRRSRPRTATSMHELGYRLIVAPEGARRYSGWAGPIRRVGPDSGALVASRVGPTFRETVTFAVTSSCHTVVLRRRKL